MPEYECGDDGRWHPSKGMEYSNHEQCILTLLALTKDSKRSEEIKLILESLSKNYERMCPKISTNVIMRDVSSMTKITYDMY